MENMFYLSQRRDNTCYIYYDFTFCSKYYTMIRAPLIIPHFTLGMAETAIFIAVSPAGADIHPDIRRFQSVYPDLRALHP